MRTIVCGTHKGPIQESFVHNKLNYIHKHHPITVLICGMARYVDTFAFRWALAHKIPIKPFPADWDKYGNSAGPIRNSQMIDEGLPELCIGFKTSAGNGTKDMMTKAHKAGIKRIWAEEFQPELIL